VRGGAAHWGEEVRRVVAFRVDSIAYGFLLYAWTATFLPLRRVASSRWTAPIALLLCVGTATLAASGVSAIAFEQSRLSQQLFPYYAAAFGSATVLLFYALAPLVERIPLVAALASGAGKISYSVYLFHILIGQIVRSALGDRPLWLQIAVYVAASVLFCTVFYVCFERPILGARPKYRARPELSEERGAVQVGA
jgi:peptidoglycan/LPS O-acetylase OafA/YrhL